MKNHPPKIYTMKKILILCATHGDEKIGNEIIKRINPKFFGLFDFLIANPKALAKNRRFIDFDLNRAYPGQKKSKLYEKRRAFEILKIAKKYKYIIDIHEAKCGTEDFIIIPRKKISKKFPLNLIDLQKVLLWPDPKGPLSQILPNSIELEFGMKKRNREKAVKRGSDVVEYFLININSKKIKENQKKFYFVYGKIPATEKIENLEDFKMKKIKGESFYPLLVNQYLKNGILCYKMKKIKGGKL